MANNIDEASLVREILSSEIMVGVDFQANLRQTTVLGASLV